MSTPDQRDPMTPIATVRVVRAEQSDPSVITVLSICSGRRPGSATRVRVRIGDLVADQAAHRDGETTSR